jgi:hypothetical protein
MNIRLLRLTTGEEVVADVTEIKLDVDGVVSTVGFELKNPVRIGMAGPSGELGMVAFSPFLKATEKVVIKNEHIMFSGELDQEIYNIYNEKFGSGIVIPGAGMKLSD